MKKIAEDITPIPTNRFGPLIFYNQYDFFVGPFEMTTNVQNIMLSRMKEGCHVSVKLKIVDRY